jgi:hypothetical protein
LIDHPRPESKRPDLESGRKRHRRKRYLFERFFLVVFFFAVFRFFAPFFFTAMLPSRVDAGEDGDANGRRDALACQSMRRREGER